MVKYISVVLRFHGILSCCIHRSVFNIGLFLTTYAVIGIHRVIFVMEIWTSSIDECNFRICTAISVFWLNSFLYCGFCTFFCAVIGPPLRPPLICMRHMQKIDKNKTQLTWGLLDESGHQKSLPSIEPFFLRGLRSC